MPVRFVRRSGWEPPTEVQLDDDELGPAERSALAVLAAVTTARLEGILRSQPHYTITISGDGPPTLLHLYDSQIPREARAFVRDLIGRAR
ncbi:hypothetical protein ACIB24_21150 [Spongisporangium articulatum]|uniref:Uncharacterized protein n=1 Tax=Spongisporangium articulatum TaxID=3362603 RepID=A0ABW8AUN2_9ACTN